MPEAGKRGRPLSDPENGPMTNAEKVRWYQRRQARLHRRMARLLLDLWADKPEEWRNAKTYVHTDVLDLARKLVGKPED